jgi:phosphoribosylamine-glycine ligase
MLDHYKKGWGSKIRSFQLQKFVAGVEIAVGAFFNGKDFVLPAFVNFEHKRMFNDDIGPSTGEMGTTAFWAGENPLFRKTLARMKDRIQGYVGYIDINCIANSYGIYPLEFTMRFGYPTINLQIEGVLSKWGEFLWALAKGRGVRAPDQAADSRSPSSSASRPSRSSTPRRSASTPRTPSSCSRRRSARASIPAISSWSTATGGSRAIPDTRS